MPVVLGDKHIEDDSEQLAFPFGNKSTHLLTPDEIYHNANQDLLGKLLEDRRIERKPASIRPEYLTEYFSMWANTAPFGGLMVIGYRNDNVVEGCTAVGQKHINELELCGTTLCSDARFQSKRVRVVNDKDEEDFVMLIRIPYREDKLVETVSGKAFDRRGATKHELNSDEKREIRIDKGQISFELEQSPLPYPEAFDIELITLYTESYKRMRNLTSDHSKEEILKISYLGRIEKGRFIANNACVLLFAKNPQELFPGCKIRFLRYSGDKEQTGERWNVEKDEWIDRGSIIRMLVEADKVLNAQLRTFSRLDKDGRFYTAPEYPAEAWYEAIVNACVHRSYEQRAMNIFVKMLDDHLVVESPGGFPPFVTPENIYEMQKPRNPHMMAAMYYLDFVKLANEGTRRMRDSMKALGLPNPVFEEKEFDARSVRVTLYNDARNRRKWIEKNASEVVGKEMWLTLNEAERKIINYLAEYETASITTLQKVTSLSWPTCSRILKSLKKRGVVTDIRKRDPDTRDPQARWTLAGGK